eukprot:jgi/Hompol1/3336/HPOL_006478-RA
MAAAILNEMYIRGFKLLTTIDLATLNLTTSTNQNTVHIRRIGIDCWLFHAPDDIAQLPSYEQEHVMQPEISAPAIASLWIHRSNSLCIVLDTTPSIHEVIYHAIESSWSKGIKQAFRHKNSSVVEYQLHGEPWNGYGKDSIHFRIVLLAIFAALDTVGWRLIASANTTDRIYDNVGIFFERSLPNAFPAYAAISFTGYDRLRLIAADDILDLVSPVIDSAVAGLCVFDMHMDLPGAKQWSLPRGIWLPKSTAVAAVVHKLVNRIVAAVERIGFQVCGAIDLTSKERDCDTLILRRISNH